MRRIILFALVLALTVTPCHALTLFQTDYDGDSYTTERVAYQAPSSGPAGHLSPQGEGWLPLRELSKILPYRVEWKDRTVYIYAERTHTIRPDWWLPEGVKIENGVTYVTPKYLRMVLSGKCFLYADELYVFDGETVHSQLVRGDADFRERVLTAMYRLRLALPEDYRLIRNCLTGGIEQSEWQEWMPEGALAYVYPTQQRPTAYIIASPRWADLTELIAHEAYHVYLTRRGHDSEALAEEYGKRISAAILETK